MVYEYKLVQLRCSPEVERIMNSLGAHGWKLVEISDGIAIFSRRSKKRSAPDVPRDDPGKCDIEKGQS